MGASYAIDMINRMRQERKWKLQVKRRKMAVDKTIQLNNLYPKQIKTKKVSAKELERIKADIRKKLKQHKIKVAWVTAICASVLLVAVYYLLQLINTHF